MRILPLLVFQFLFVAAASAQSTPDAETCASTSGTANERMAACNRAITSEKLSAKNLAITFYNRGLLWGRMGDHDRAISDYTETIRLDPGDASAYYNRGNAWKAKGDIDRAVSDYSEALRVNPQHAGAYNNRGVAWQTKGDNDRAISDYNGAIRINPQYATAYNNRGNAWKAKGDDSKAIQDYTEAIRLNPQYANAYNGLAWRLASSKDARVRDGKRAVELAQKACELSEWKLPILINTLAAAYAEAGNFDEAIRWQEKAMEFPEFMNTHGDKAREQLALYRDRKPYRE